MSGDASRVHDPAPELWDDAHAAGLDEPALPLCRSNLLGSDLHITDFSGGGASAKVDRQRSLLKLSVYPQDIAEAACFFASDAAAKSTAAIINVDADNAISFTR